MKKRHFFTLFAIILLVLQIWFQYVILRYPFLGILLEQDSVTQSWSIKGFESNGIGSHLGLQIGDELLEIDGKPPQHNMTVTKWHNLEQTDHIKINRSGTVIDVEAGGKRNDISLYLFPAAGEIVSLIIAMILHVRVKHSNSARLLTYVFLVIAVIYMSLGASIRGDTLGKIVITGFMMLLPTVFLHFLKAFFEDKKTLKVSYKLLQALYIVIMITMASQFAYFIPDFTYFVYQNGALFAEIYFLCVFLLIFSALTVTFIKTRKEKDALAIIVNTIWVSQLITFGPVILLSFLPKIILGREWVSSFYTGWFILFFPLSFAYLIISKQLYDIEVVLRRVMFTVLISFVPSLLLTVLFASGSSASLIRDGIFFLITLSVTSILLYSLEYITTKLEKIMFPRKYFLQMSLKKIAKNLSSVTTFRQLKEIILSDIVSTMQVFGGAVVFELPDNVEVISEGAVDVAEIERLLREQKLLDHPDYHTFEINRHEEYASYFVMTRKKTNTLLSREEIQWLNLILSYLSVSLENVYLIRKLNMKTHEIASQLSSEKGWQDLVWLRKSMFQLQERERVRISNDLHDTTMQDIFFVMRKVKSLFKVSQSAEAQKQLTDIVTHLELINMNLRQCCFELNPHLIQNVGLAGALQNFLDLEAGLAPFELSYSIAGPESIERLDLETKRHVFRVVQELVTNAKKHAGANTVIVKLSASGNELRIQYADDGAGFDKNAGTNKGLLSSSGLGLEQMKTRILHLGGRLELQSAPGQGVKANVTIPIREGMTA